MQKNVFNGLWIGISSLLILLASGFLFAGTDDSIQVFQENVIESILFRCLSFWLLGFILLAILVLINYIFYKSHFQSFIKILVIGSICNLVFALIGSILFFSY